MTAKIATVTATAKLGYRLGLHIVPPQQDGTKRPVSEYVPVERLIDLLGEDTAQALCQDDPGTYTWKHWRIERPSREQMRSWYSEDGCHGIGVLTGVNGLEALEFDNPETFETFCDTAEAGNLADVVARLRTGYEERTPGGGVHWLYFCDQIAGNTKLAARPNPEDPNRTLTLVETRGEGGFLVISPSGGDVHPSGGSYKLVSGSLETIPTITPDERQLLHELARAFDDMPKQEYERGPSSEQAGDRPGDDFDERGPDWPALLEPAGWTLVHRRGDIEYWRRPGKDRGVSATLNAPGIGPNRLYVFTSSTTFKPMRSYSPFQAYVVLEHAGDFQAAARDLGKQGYGADYNKTQLILTNGKRHEPISGTKRVSYPLTDTGNAERIVNRFGERIRYVTAWEQWLVFDGKRWAKDQSRQLERMAKTVARELFDEAGQLKDEKLKGAVTKFARRSESTAGKRNMIVSAQAEPGIVLDHDALDSQTHYLNTQSGTVDLRTGELRQFERLDYLSKITSAPYMPRAGAPIWTGFLERIFDGDTELISYIQRAVGYSFTGATTEQVIFIVYGEGANGKSTFLNTLMNLAGPYGRDTPAQTLYERNTDAIPNDLAALQGARIVSAFETDDRRSLSEGRVKQMTGGDRISARFLRAEWFEFVPQFKAWLATNHKPEIKGTDHAIWRRLRPIPFTVTIEDDEIDPELPAKLEAEAAGILTWVVEGARIWHEQGLNPTPVAVLDATQAYREESDYVGQWISDRCELLPDAQESSSALYADFVEWSRKHGRSPVSQTRFGREITSMEGLKKRKTMTVMVIDGIQLKRPATISFS